MKKLLAAAVFFAAFTQAQAQAECAALASMPDLYQACMAAYASAAAGGGGGGGFAAKSWDYFPVKDAGKGEAKAGILYNLDAEAMALSVKARYSVIQGLELAVFWDTPTEDILLNFSVGARYWINENLGFFATGLLPIEEGVEFDLAPGVQYSMKVSDAFEFGSQLALLNLLNDGDMWLSVGLEADFPLGALTPYVGPDISIPLGDGDIGIDINAGVTFAINETFAVDAGIVYATEPGALTILANVGVSF